MKIKYLGKNLIKETSDLYKENIEPLKTRDKDTRKWKDIPMNR